MPVLLSFNWLKDRQRSGAGKEKARAEKVQTSETGDQGNTPSGQFRPNDVSASDAHLRVSRLVSTQGFAALDFQLGQKTESVTHESQNHYTKLGLGRLTKGNQRGETPHLLPETSPMMPSGLHSIRSQVLGQNLQPVQPAHTL